MTGLLPAHTRQPQTSPANRAPLPGSTRPTFRDRLTRLATAITTPLLPDDYLDMISPLRAGADLRGRIEAVRPETADAATLVITPGRGWRSHIPGQHLRVGVDVDGVRHWRTYSLTGPADAAGRLTITVKAIPDGVVSEYLVRHARPGLLIRLDQAAGDFVLPPRPPGKILFVTAGSGITPVMGMLRDRIDQLRDVVLVHSAPAADDVVFGRELRWLAAQGRITLHEHHTTAGGRLGGADLAALVPDLAERQTWACGPTGLLDAVEAYWAATGIAEKLHTERFRPAVITPGEGGAVRFTETGTTVDADGATPLLDAGESAGVLMPSGCRMGICFGCVAPLREGAVRDLRTGDVTTAAPGDGVLVQTCVSAAAGACEVEL